MIKVSLKYHDVIVMKYIITLSDVAITIELGPHGMIII